MLLTRPVADSERVAALCAQAGVETEILALTEIRQADAGAPVPPVDLVVLSSANAVPAIARIGLTSMPVLCVGSATTAKARAAGCAEAAMAGETAAELVAAIRAAAPSSVLYLRGKAVTTALGPALADTGISVHERVVYESVAVDVSESPRMQRLASGGYDAVTVWSRRNGEILNDLLAHVSAKGLGRTDLVGISDAAVKPLAGTGFRRIFVATRPNTGSMVGAMIAAMRQ